MKDIGNWLGWIMQFIPGCMAGAYVGFLLVYRRRVGPWMIPEAIPWFLLGASLVGGALASHLGDKLWIGDNYKVIPPESPNHTAASVICSIAVGLAGVACAAYALMMHFGFLKA